MKCEGGREFEIKLDLTGDSVIELERCGIINQRLHNYFTYLSKSEPGGKRAGYFKAGCRENNNTHISISIHNKNI